MTRDGFVQPRLFLECQTEIGQRQRMVRLQFQRGSQSPLGFDGASAIEPADAQIVVRPGIIGTQFDHSLMVVGRTCVPPRRAMNDRTVLIQLRKVRAVLNRAAEQFDCLVRPPLPPDDGGFDVQCACMPRIPGQDTLTEGTCDVIGCGLHSDVGEHGPRTVQVGISRE